MNTKPTISIVIPCFNEAPYIQGVAESVLRTFEPDSIEMIIVNDGSTDGSSSPISELLAIHPQIKQVLHPKNLGKGAAIRTGVMAAMGSVIGFIDGDGEVDPQYLVEATSIISESEYVDIVIGNRYMIPNGYKTTAVRRLYSNVYRLMNWVLFALPWKDTQAGLKVFRSSVAKELFGTSEIQGYAFDIDILAHAHLRKLRVEELPIMQSLKGSSTITKRHILQMIVDTVETYRRFMPEECRLSMKRHPALFVLCIVRQLLALPTALAAWFCAKSGLLVLSKMHRQ